MKVYIEQTKKQVELPSCTGADLLQKLGINPDTVLIVQNNSVVLPETKLSETDDIKILSVVSGG